MPKETLFRMPGHNLEVGWSKGGEATANVVASLSTPVPETETFTEAELDHAIAVLQKIRKQTFETSLADVLTSSEYLTRLAKTTPNMWRILKAAQPNVPNSEANFVPSDEGVSSHVKWDTATSFDVKLGDYAQPEDPEENPNMIQPFYLREKRTVEPMTNHLARQVKRDKNGQLQGGDELRVAVHRDFLELKARFDNFLELVLRQVVFGRVTMDWGVDRRTGERNLSHLDYMFPEDRFVMGNDFETGIPWAIQRFKDTHDDMTPTHAYLSAELYAEIEDPWRYGPLKWCPNPAIPGEGGEPVLQPESRKIAFVNWEGDPLRVVEGPSADYEAPDDHVGLFGKGWKQSDPSSRLVLLEWSFAPVWDKPQVVVLDLP